MKILSWNVRGLGMRSKSALIKDLLRSFNPDIVFLQESRLAVIDRSVIKSIWSSRHVGWMSLGAQNSAGVSL